ncbi:restriction endonuclease, partial [Bacteroides caecigallinarum]|nr:restriction endonuclease [Bacteroides caecigallinarum]
DKYKVFIPEANGNGFLGETLSKTEIGKPYDSATSTFISIGSFNSEEEAKNCSKYLKTKLLRCLLGMLKKTQHTPPSVWAYIPIQDFTAKSDIDWNKSIAEIDQQLYTKYGLDMFEIEFIEKMIKPME